jgi:hypothetical protein
MRIMRITAMDGNGATTQAAVDLDGIVFAYAEGEHTLAFSPCDLSIKVKMPFEEFLGYWSQDRVITPGAKENPMTRSISVEDILLEEE